LLGLARAQVGELLVNDDTIGGAPQVAPDVAFLGDGRFLAVWEDYRRCDYDANIYGQYFDSSGTPQDTNWVVNEDTMSRTIWNYRQIRPALAVSLSGGYAVSWEDCRCGPSHIYYQSFDRQGNRIGPNRRAIPDTNVQTRPDIAAYDNGGYVLVWEQALESGGQAIRGVITDSFGNPGPELQLDDVTRQGTRSGSEAALRPTSLGQEEGAQLCRTVPVMSPDRCETPVAAAWSDGFAVGWSQRSLAGTVRLRWFDRAGNARGASLAIPRSNVARARIACDQAGNGLVVWEDVEQAEIWGQRFDATGGLLGQPFRISEPANCWRFQPAVATVPDGSRFLVCWQECSSAAVRIAARFLSQDGTFLGSSFQLDSATHVGQQSAPAVALRDSGSFAVVWEDTRENNSDVYGTVGACTHYRGAAARDFRANSDRASSLQDFPVIVLDGKGRSTVFWYDFRYDPTNSVILGQRFDPDMFRVGHNFQVNDDPPGHRSSFLWAAGNRAGMTVVAWEDNRRGDADIFAQVYDTTGTGMGPNFLVNDNSDPSAQTWPHVAINDSGDFIVAWSDNRSGTSAPFAQRFDRHGARVGHNWQVDSSGREPGGWLSNQGDFWITWKSDNGIKVRHYNAAQQSLDTILRISDDASGTLASPELVGTGAGSVWIAWMDHRRGNWDIFAQRLSSSGQPLGGNFRVNDDDMPADHTLPSLSYDGDSTIYLTWSDSRILGNLDVRGRAYATVGTALDTSFLVNTDPYPNADQWAYGSVSARGKRVVFAWLDNRNRRSWDVYARDGKPAEPYRSWWRSLSVLPSVVLDGRCRVQPSSAIVGSARLQVFDAVGRLRQAVEIVSGGGKFDLNCSGLTSGVYYALLSARIGAFHGRFVVVNAGHSHEDHEEHESGR
jgi:hypothetical protein